MSIEIRWNKNTRIIDKGEEIVFSISDVENVAHLLSEQVAPSLINLMCGFPTQWYWPQTHFQAIDGDRIISDSPGDQEAD